MFSLPIKSLFFALLLLIPGYAAAQALQSLYEGEALKPSVQGIWQNPGYGWTIVLSRAGIEFYNDSDAGCIEDPATAEFIGGYIQYYSLDGNRLKLSFQPEGSTVYMFNRLETLPASCSVEIGSTPKEVFDYFWGVMDAHYAFFDLYEVAWKARYAQYAPQVADDMSESALFELLGTVMEGLNDGHLELYAEIDGEEAEFSASRTRVVGREIDKAFAAQSKFKERSEFSGNWYLGNQKRLRKMLKRRGRGEAVDGDMYWGKIGDIGYIHLRAMGGFAEKEDATLAEELAAISQVMDKVLTSFADTEGLILDISLNGGGMDEVSLAIASHFADKKRLAYTKIGHGEQGAPQSFYIKPAASERYLKPIILLTSDVTVSAAEIFTMAMRTLPHVTHHGDATWGALSDILPKTLPNGWQLSLSHEIYKDAEGILWEGKGIYPEVYVKLFDAANLHKSHSQNVMAIARALGNKPAK